ncbi:MAG: ThiF family adenylyltransferase [Rhodobacteraceae bacterium]|nr:ThiF family adenylyltransferase [Paracoccaceae bacterium]
MINYERYEGLIDQGVMAKASILCVGAGGAANLYRNLARAGVGKLALVDHDDISATNPATQAFGSHQIGKKKVAALVEDIARINPNCDVTAHPIKIQNLMPEPAFKLQDYDLILAMTDNFMVQAALNRIACKRGIDALFAAAYYNGAAVEVTGSFRCSIEAGCGCHRCNTYLRYKAYADGFKPTRNAGSHIFQAEYLNALLGNMVVSLLHDNAGSELGNPHLAQRFLASPLIVSRLNPTYAAQENEAFSCIPADQATFTTRHWPRDLPPGFVCADCGTTYPDYRAGASKCAIIDRS